MPTRVHAHVRERGVAFPTLGSADGPDTQILQKIKEIQVRKFSGPPLAVVVVVVVVVYCLNTLMELGDVVWSK